MNLSLKQPIKVLAAATVFSAISVLSSSKALAQTSEYPILKQGSAIEITADTSKHGRIYRLPPKREGAIKGFSSEIDSSAFKGKTEETTAPQGASKIDEKLPVVSSGATKIISTKGFYNKKDVLEILNPAYKNELGIIGTDKDSLYLRVDYLNDNIKKICRRLGFSGVVHAVLLPVNKEAYADFAKEAKKHSSKYKKNPYFYSDSLIIAKSEKGDIFYLLLGVARNTGDASTQEFDKTYDMWSAQKNSKLLTLSQNKEILIPFDGEFGLVALANYPNGVPAPAASPPAPQVQEKAPLQDEIARTDTFYVDKPIFVPIILALNLEGFEMKEKNLYFNDCYNYLLDFRGKGADEIMWLYEEWLFFKNSADAKKKASQQTKYINSFEGY